MKKIKLIATVMILTMASSVIFSGCKKKDDEYRLVKVENVSGEVTVERDSEKDTLDAFEGMNLISKDEVSVGSESSLELIVDSDKHMIAEANTSFELTATGDEKAGKVRIDMTAGEALFEIENKLNDDSSFEVSTPNAVFSVRGTEFKVSYDKDTKESKLEVIKGVVAVEYEDGKTDEVEAGAGKLITKDLVEDITPADDTTPETTSNNNSGDKDNPGVPVSSNTDDAIKQAYRDIVANMADFIKKYPKLDEEYIVRDYMIYDYNKDGRDEVILYLEFKKDDVFYRDVVFLHYDDAKQEINAQAIVTDEQNDTHFYAIWQDKLIRYSWRTNPMESYIYSVAIKDGSLCYVLEEGYDEIIGDIEAAGMKPLPLYGEWEIPFI